MCCIVAFLQRRLSFWYNSLFACFTVLVILLFCQIHSFYCSWFWLCSLIPNYIYLKFLPRQPGMNRCNISEEETTKALNALYQMPVPQSNTSLNGVPNVAASNTILPDPHHLSHALDNNVNSAGAIGKKKHKLKDQANPVNDSASLLISSSAKKNQLASFKSRSLNDVNHPLDSNMPSKVVLEHVSKSTDFSSDKQNLKHKEKDRILGRHSDGGGFIIGLFLLANV